MAINLGTGQLCTVCGRPTPWTDWTKCEEHNHSTLQPIPTVREYASYSHLVRMFDAMVGVRGSLCLFESREPHAPGALEDWARARKHRVQVVHHEASEVMPEPFSLLVVEISPSCEIRVHLEGVPA